MGEGRTRSSIEDAWSTSAHDCRTMNERMRRPAFPFDLDRAGGIRPSAPCGDSTFFLLILFKKKVSSPRRWTAPFRPRKSTVFSIAVSTAPFGQPF